MPQGAGEVLLTWRHRQTGTRLHRGLHPSRARPRCRGRCVPEIVLRYLLVVANQQQASKPRAVAMAVALERARALAPSLKHHQMERVRATLLALPKASKVLHLRFLHVDVLTAVPRRVHCQAPNERRGISLAPCRSARLPRR